ncbi:ankyrin repeat protein [Fusarium oxysporum f. sp. albedinis]|nr:ankyrin repeat protein [Fusarium oxysporum f. sp. albedinis]
MEVARAPVPDGASAGPRKSLEDAIQDFQAILTDDQRQKLSSIGAIQDPDTAMIFTAQLDRDNQLKKGRGIACRLSSVLQSVQTFSTVVDTFVSSHPQIAALVWGSIKLAMLQEFEPDVNDIQRLGKEVKDEINLAKAQIDHQEQMLQEKERVAASKQRSRLRKFIPKVESELDTIKELQIQRSTRRSMKERQRLLESLSSHDYVTPFQEARKKHKYSTAEWIFTTPEFTRWYDGTGSVLLWCSGKIGSGKTILCANVINHVLIEKNRDDRAAFFFLQYDNSDSLTAETIIRSIIRQSTDATTLPEHVEYQLRELDRKYFVQLQDWAFLLQQRIEHSGIFFIFIDGLDECDVAERRALLEVLSSLAITTLGLRIFIASRDSVYVDLKGRFSHIEHVSMAPVNLASDIRIYVEATVQERMRNGDLVCGDTRLLNDIRDTLTRHADGMFLWVTFLINEVCIASCDDDIRQSLRSLPKDLEETFARALSRILFRQKKAELVQKVFRWVAAAKRPLTLDEIREAVSIDVGQPYLKTERLVREMSPIVLWCENLLQVTEGQPQSLQFAHSTIHDFITKGDLPIQLSDFHVDLEVADHFAGEICITYLHLNNFKTTVARRPQPLRVNPVAMAGTALGRGSKVTELTTRFVDVLGCPKAKANPDLAGTLISYDRADGLDRLQQNHPFLKYAAKHWVSHTANFQKGRSSTWSLWYQITTNGHALAHVPWQESIFHRNEEVILIWSHQTHHYALLRYANSVPGLPEPKRIELMRTSASEGDDEAIAIFLDAGYGRTALQAASAGSHIQIVERLLVAGADVNVAAAAEEGRTALQAASAGGHIQVVERLLEAGANVNAAAAARYGRTALQAASAGGHIQVVERLLEAGADVNVAAAAEEGRTALQAASAGGHIQAASAGSHIQIVERLLVAGADVNVAAAAEEGRTALQAASAGGHIQVVERLLEAGANVNAAAAARYGRTALQAASAGGHIQVVERLLEAGADVNVAAAAEEGRTALQAASAGGHIQVVERLLNAGANISAAAAARYGRTTLQAASEGGHIQIVERLLEAGADVNAAAAEEGGRTALQAASAGGHIQVVERLLDAGANVVDRLLNAGADVNAAAAAEEGRTALQAASAGGHIQVVERLLVAGANVNAAAAAAEEGRTALQAASAGGHIQVVERLLVAGANVNAAAAAEEGRTALQAASAGGHIQVVERLLVAGANVNAAAAARYGRTALQAASAGGHIQVVERLLNAGANISAAAAARYRRTALQAASEGGHIQVVERLLEAGADVNAAAAEEGGRTAL